MKYKIDLQQAELFQNIPSIFQFQRWVNLTLEGRLNKAELTIRIVDEDEIQNLNNTYRKKNKPTNILSFPFELPNNIKLEIPLLGDMAICASIIEKEANEQNKTLEAHWAHMTIHGLLHLLGFDHVEESQALEMETLEINLLKKLGIDNPYEE